MATDKKDIWEQLRAARRARCVHFTGVQNLRCRLGIEYASVRTKAGSETVWACLGNTACRPACPEYQPTPEATLDAEDREARRVDELIERGPPASPLYQGANGPGQGNCERYGSSNQTGF